MALAFAHPEPPEETKKGGRGKKDPAKETGQKVGGFGRELLRQARFVYRVIPERAAEA